VSPGAEGSCYNPGRTRPGDCRDAVLGQAVSAAGNLAAGRAVMAIPAEVMLTVMWSDVLLGEWERDISPEDSTRAG